MLANLRLDVALVARLRPASLVVPARLLLGVVGEILEPASAQAVEVPELAADHDDEGALPAPDERHERSEVERSSHVDLVGDGFRQREACARCCRARTEKIASPCAPSRSNSLS